jgi:hypothetical protein
MRGPLEVTYQLEFPFHRKPKRRKPAAAVAAKPPAISPTPAASIPWWKRWGMARALKWWRRFLREWKAWAVKAAFTGFYTLSARSDGHRQVDLARHADTTGRQ